METLIFLTIGWSITSILVNGSIFDGLRNYLLVKHPIFAKLLSCMQCSGFWIGFLLGSLATSGIIYHPLCFLVEGSGLPQQMLTIVFYAFLNSGVSVLLNGVMIMFTFKNHN